MHDKQTNEANGSRAHVDDGSITYSSCIWHRFLFTFAVLIARFNIKTGFYSIVNVACATVLFVFVLQTSYLCWSIWSRQRCFCLTKPNFYWSIWSSFHSTFLQERKQTATANQEYAYQSRWYTNTEHFVCAWRGSVVCQMFVIWCDMMAVIRVINTRIQRSTCDQRQQ